MRLTRLTAGRYEGVVFLDLEQIESLSRDSGPDMLTRVRTRSGDEFWVEDQPEDINDLLCGGP